MTSASRSTSTSRLRRLSSSAKADTGEAARTSTVDSTRTEINRRYLPGQGPAPGRGWPVGGQRRGARPDAFRRALLPVLLAYALVFAAILRARPVRVPEGSLHADALVEVDRFVEQYPLHLYPLLAKALELAHLRRELPQYTAEADRVLELAIGDGTLSRHVFPAGTRVVGADIAPVSLRFAARMAHVERAVVCDCLDPPFAPGSFDLVVSNNFLHHVSAKEETLTRWLGIAELAVFSENSRYWASSWVRPTVLRAIGFRRRARETARAIEESHFQDLRTLEELDRITSRAGELVARETCFDATTFFLASTFSSLMLSTGPPTPAATKSILVGPLRPFALRLTRTIARGLIAFDATRDRTRDVYTLYVVRSRSVAGGSGGGLVCPECGGPVGDTACTACGRSFPGIDGMLFVLRDDLRHIADGYDVAGAESADSEQL